MSFEYQRIILFFFCGERAERDGTGNIRCSVFVLSARVEQ